jgi:hypothetical protein
MSSAGLSDVPFLTCGQVFDNDRLPQRLLIMRVGPIGTNKQ